jgi:shikimate dehydrogenase
MQSAGLHALGLDWEYHAHAVAPDELEGFVLRAGERGFRGLNVTIPHKEAALKLCEPDELAARVGAVNTLVYEGDKIRGYNTDVHGFEMLLKQAGARDDGEVLVLGAGGAARAVVAALLGRARGLTLIGRTIRPFVIGGETLSITAWDPATLPALLARADLLVDATPRALDPAAVALDLAPLPAHAVVVDLVVQKETPLVQAARARGLRAEAGAEMLLHQGARALELWTGKPAPIDAMRAALLAAL